MDVIKDGKLNPEWIKEVDKKDNLMSKIRGYYLPGTKIKPEFKCSATSCLLPVRSAEYLQPITAKYEYNPMLFCFTCNQVYHVRCVGLNKEAIAEEAVPWLCLPCRENVLNPQACAYYASSGYKTDIATRRKKFLRVSTIEGPENEFDTDGEFDSCDLDSFERSSHKKATKLPSSSSSESEKLQRDLAQAKSESSKLMKLLEQERNDAKLRFDSMFQEMQKMRLEINAQKSEKSIQHQAEAVNTNETFSMSTFYAGNVNSPDSESTRWKCNVEEVNQTQVPQISINNSQGDTSTLEVLSRFTECQERMQLEKELTTVRRAMPKITEFSGDIMKWLEFEQDVNRYRTVCKYDDPTIKLHVRGALKGDAFEAVKDVFDIFTLKQIMDVLKESFGDPMTMVRHKGNEIKALKIPGTIYREDAVKIRVVLQGYFAACTYAKTGYLNSNELAELIYEQLNYEDKARCKEMFVRKDPGKQIVICLSTIYDYLAERLLILDEKPDSLKVKGKDDKRPKSIQVMTIGNAATSSRTRNDKNSYKFEVRDRSTAPYMGYDLQLLSSVNKKCEICNRTGHYSVQCNQFQSMSEEQRLKAIIDKRLCKNCVVTTGHKASECNLKVSCGMRAGKFGRCTQKHHATIHYACDKVKSGGYLKRRSQTRNNTNNAQQTMNNAAQNNNPPAQNNTPPVQNNNAGQQHNINTSQQNFMPIQQQQVANAIRLANAQQPNVNANVGASSSGAAQARTYNVNPNGPNATYTIQMNHLSDNMPRTVKMFKNKFIGSKGFVVAYSVGDSAAEVTLVRNDLRIALGIEGTPETLSVTWTDKTIREYVAVKFDIKLQGVLKHSEPIVLKDCYAIDEFHLPARTLDMKKMRAKFPYLKGVNFDSYFEEEPVMLIGSPHAYAIESITGLIEGGPGNPVAMETKLGVTVYGGDSNKYSIPSNVNLTIRASGSTYNSILETAERVSNDELSDLLVHFNSVESLGIRACDSRIPESEQKAIDILKEEMKVLEDGTIEVPLVWNRKEKEIPSLPNNYALAFKRQLAHEKKLEKNPVHQAEYNKNVKELLKLGYMRYATQEDLNGNWPNIWYLPMSLVVNENKTPAKYRNVYDASARYEGVSLNDKLLKGPDLLIGILKPLLRMRMNKVAYTADVQHMFHRMKISLRDQQCQRVLWRESSNQSMQTLILSSMAFGPASSPFTSQFVKNWNADNWSEKYPEAAEAIKELMYMDDLIASESSPDKAVQVALDCIKICKHVNWNLISFQSNSLDFLKQLPCDNVRKESFQILANEAEGFTTKVLGCHWNTVEDCFVFELHKNIFIKLVTEFKHHPTKRDQSSTLARVYDAMGLIAHFMIRGKILLQRSWKAKIKWDDPIPEETQHEWCKWLEGIEDIAKLKIPRQFATLSALKDADKLQLHVFCDAGVEAFGAVAYWVTHHHGKVESSMIIAKAKVTPLRLQTKTEIKGIPRLELFAAVLAVRLGDKISNYFRDLEFERFFWSDSEVVLRWILNPEARLLKYAVGPVDEILVSSFRSEWRYVPTASNPADLCTKFKKFDFGDSSSVWFVGPEFLKNSLESWPQMPEKLMIDEVVLANNIYLQKLNYSTHKLPPTDCPIFDDSFIDKLSPSIQAKWTKLRRAVARRIKLFWDVFIPLVINKQFLNQKLRMEIKEIYKGFRHLTSADLERADHFIFRKIQRESLLVEYEQISKGQHIRNKELMQLSVFMDQQGMMRINARTNLNRKNYPQQFVPVLPKKNAIVSVLLMYFHEKYNHIAAESQIAEIRTICWIPQVRQVLRSVKAHCNECILRSVEPCDPVIGPLPEYRVNPDLEPFEVTGVDLMGPIMTIQYGRVKKVWIMIFTCALTRFVHLHIVDSLESIKVLEAIVIFIAAHGPVRKFISDNGTNFVGAARIIEEDYKNSMIFFLQQPESLGQELAEKFNIEWSFIPPGSPWFGGFYERFNREIKRSLGDTLTKRRLTKVELNIAVHETAHRLNLRPLTHNPIGAEDEPVLTPHHLAKHRSGWPLLPGMHNGKFVAVDDRSIYRKGRMLADELMRKFTSFYLPVLTKRVKWLKETEPLKIDDLVLMIEPNMTRKEWPRGRILKLFYGKDGTPRVADVIKANGKVKRRPVRKLARINIQSSAIDI